MQVAERRMRTDVTLILPLRRNKFSLRDCRCRESEQISSRSSLGQCGKRRKLFHPLWKLFAVDNGESFGRKVKNSAAIEFNSIINAIRILMIDSSTISMFLDIGRCLLRGRLSLAKLKVWDCDMRKLWLQIIAAFLFNVCTSVHISKNSRKKAKAK